MATESMGRSSVWPVSVFRISPTALTITISTGNNAYNSLATLNTQLQT